ncbi:hypothetical protein PYW08_012405 [Mythimna loreyi]|uniref:Uncharacterized protein n=1 Tax=Mythimna loreyi TaxID=667449 RepID=A0ACC2Q058_9NEOP|nr:hypothetical protein PYW08_012405 [Mythimna loreyi]
MPKSIVLNALDCINVAKLKEIPMKKIHVLTKTMEKLSMCRVCLAQDVRMFVVVNKNLQELYERLTGSAFVTGDSRPMLACFICCTKLKQCCQLQRKCLEAEERFTLMMNEDYEVRHLSTGIPPGLIFELKLKIEEKIKYFFLTHFNTYTH